MLLAGLAVSFVLSIVACYKHDTSVTYIESASLDGQMSGTFGLFGGTIDEDQYYFFYVEESGGRVLHRAPAEDTAIIETDDREPQYVKIDCATDKLYVPEGAVVAGYDVVQPGIETGDG